MTDPVHGSGELGARAPRVRAPVPGAKGTAWVQQLAETECPALTARRARRSEATNASHDPLVWTEARGANVRDVDDNIYVDLTAGFGAAAVGHAHPDVTAAARRQTERLPHALGDVYPSDTKIALLSRLAELAPWPDARVILGLGGADAVEAALKTAVLATGRAGIVAFDGGYHGLSHGPLAACGYKAAFRTPFGAQLNPHVTFAPWPTEDTDVAQAVAAVEAAWDDAAPIGAVIVEPVQGRAGVRIPPPGFLPALARLCRARGAVLVADEILTGLGRCGPRWLSADPPAGNTSEAPDLLCVGKALGGGFPVSACLGRPEVMAAWSTPVSADAASGGDAAASATSFASGEALHTGTFFGHPVACAAALAALDALDDADLHAEARAKASQLDRALSDVASRHDVVRDVRGTGMLIGIELDRQGAALQAVRRLVEHGYLALPAGMYGEVVQLVPPLPIAATLLEGFVETFDTVAGAL